MDKAGCIEDGFPRKKKLEHALSKHCSRKPFCINLDLESF